MPLVLREVQNRAGEVKRFNVVRAEEGTPLDILEDIKEGEYRVMDGSTIEKYSVSYRTVQDTVKV